MPSRFVSPLSSGLGIAVVTVVVVVSEGFVVIAALVVVTGSETSAIHFWHVFPLTVHWATLAPLDLSALAISIAAASLEALVRI